MSLPKRKLPIRLFAHSRPSLTVKETATALGCTANHVRSLIDTGVFLVFAINDRATVKREHLRIRRFSVEAWWVMRDSEPDKYDLPADVAGWMAELRTRPTYGKGGGR